MPGMTSNNSNFNNSQVNMDTHSDIMMGGLQQSLGAVHRPQFQFNGPPPQMSPPPQDQSNHHHPNPAADEPDLLDYALRELTLRDPCRLCKGQKHNFTNYFHNPEMFSTLPHNILALIEDGYFLKHTLQSLLVTYVAHEFDPAQMEAIRRRIQLWGEGVTHLVNRVVASAGGFQVELKLLGDVKNWADNMILRIWNHVTGQKKLEFAPEGWSDLVQDFRKLWEKVWQSYMRDHASEQWEKDAIPSMDF